MKKIIALALSSLLISACGWHLRGSGGVDLSQVMQSLYLDSEHYSEFSTELQRGIKASGIELAKDSNSAPFKLKVGKLKQERRSVAVGSQVLTSEYELSIAVDYSIEEISDAKDAYKHSATGSVIRSYAFNPQDTLGGNREESLIRREMRNDLVQQILRQLRYVKPSAKTPASVSSESGQEQQGITAEPAQ